MKNLLAANPVRVGKRFVTIKNQESNPGVVSLGQDSKLNLIIKVDGKPRLVDLGSGCRKIFSHLIFTRTRL